MDIMNTKEMWLSHLNTLVDGFHYGEFITDLPFEPTGYMIAPILNVDGRIWSAKTVSVLSLDNFVVPTGTWYIYMVSKITLGGATSFKIRYAE